MARIPGGSFVPLFLQAGEAEVKVDSFRLDRRQVTRGEFLEFVRANPRWRRSQVKPIFTEEGYLADWPGDLDTGDGDDARRPVTQVSWFAAKAYCEAQGARLPTVDEWEYAAAASQTERDASRDPVFLQWLLELYTRPVPRPLPPVGSGFRNIYGIEDLHGPVREWVLDYNTVMVSDDSRGVGARDHQLYCAAGAIGSTRTDDYVAFLRYTFRSGLNGRSTVDNLGFRCAGGQ
jgi:formylglycine-generating enzyme required for sulfatase activity